MPAKGEERKVEVTASCDSYPLPIQETISLLAFSPLPSPLSGGKQSAMGVEEEHPAIGALRGKRGRGAARQPGGRSRAAGRERRGRKEKAWDSVCVINKV